ncbi:GntR family transcriptional regulator, partial [Curtobacterium sp. 22159]|uniref:GntR family transcriptional regulator n=1 Tax=Curtobacterium sp. 22159 TaxID=3453882 RepID=UPI003F845EED
MVRSVDQIGGTRVDQLPDRGKSAVVVARVRGMIRDGTLAAGDALPSTRALAAELGVARGTVVAAYEQLDGEGWIRTRQGAAARVEAGVPSGGDGAAGRGAAGPGAAGP